MFDAKHCCSPLIEISHRQPNALPMAVSNGLGRTACLLGAVTGCAQQGRPGLGEAVNGDPIPPRLSLVRARSSELNVLSSRICLKAFCLTLFASKHAVGITFKTMVKKGLFARLKSYRHRPPPRLARQCTRGWSEPSMSALRLVFPSQ